MKDVNAQSVGKGRVSKLSPAVDELCAAMLIRLDRINETSTEALEAAPGGTMPARAAEGNGLSR